MHQPVTAAPSARTRPRALKALPHDSLLRGRASVGRCRSEGAWSQPSPPARAARRPLARTTLLPAYLDGLADEGIDANPRDVEAGWAIALAIRSVFTALAVDHRTDLDPTARDQLLARRALTCRFGLDLALRVADRLG